MAQFTFYDRTGICRLLEQQAEKGWVLDKVTNYAWRLRRMEPKKLHYAVTYFPKASAFDPGPTEQQRELHEFCAHSGWILAGTTAQMQIFYNENEDPIPIETDPMVQIDTIHKAMKKNFIPSSLLMIAVSLMILCMNVAKFIISPVSVLSSHSDFFISFSYIMLFLISAVELGQYYIWRKKAIQLAEEGMSIPSGKTAKLFQTVVRAVMLIMLIIYAVMSLGIISPWLLFTIFAIFGGSGVAAFYLKEFLRKKNVSRHLNMALTFGTIIAVTIFMVFILVWAAVNYDLPTSPKDSKPVGSYTTPQGFEFDIYDDEGTKQFDGSGIYALICDKRWFKIRTKDMFMDEFYNANNRSWQQYLNVIKAFNYSLFANAYMLVGAIPSVPVTSAVFNETSPSVVASEKITLSLTTTPFNATDTITFSSSATGKATVTKIDNRHVEVTGVEAGSATISAKVGTTSIASVSVTVNAAS
jgi:hypothetical protein